MKKLAIVGAILLVVVGLATSPAQVEAGSPQEAPVLGAEDQAFLATLAALEVVPAPELATPRVDCNALFLQCENGCPNNCVKSFRCSPYSCVCGHPCI